MIPLLMTELLRTQAALSKSLSSPVCIGGYPLLGGGIKVVRARIVFVRRTEIDLVLAESSEKTLNFIKLK